MAASAFQGEKAIRKQLSVAALESEHEIHEGVCEDDGVEVSQGFSGPLDAGLRRRPNSKKRATVRKRKLPPRDEIWHRRTERVNQELADDLRGRLTVVIGGALIWVPGGYTIRK